MRKAAILCGVSAVVLASASPAMAQDAPADQAKTTAQRDSADGEIVVTATRRTENLMTTAISGSVLTGDDLANKGVVNVDALQFATPSIVVNNFGQGNDFNVRGIGKAEHNTQTTTGVITYRDGAPSFPGYVQGEPYFDIANIQVLRGPQGTIVGQNATGGAVFVNTNDPIIGGGVHGYVNANYGNYNDLGGQGAINLPVSDTFAARVAFYGERRDGFYNITGPGGSSYPGNNDLRMMAGRVSFLWKPSSNFSILSKTDLDYLNYGAYPAGPYWQTFKTLPNGSPNPQYRDLFDITHNALPLRARDKFFRSILKVEYDTDSGIKFRSITSYAKANTQYGADLDGTSSDYGNPITGAAPLNRYFYDNVSEKQITQEFNIISPDKQRFTWLLGAFGVWNDYTFNPPFDNFDINLCYPATQAQVPACHYQLKGTNPTRSLAAFGQVGFNLTDALKLEIGGRYTASRSTNHVDVLQYPLTIDRFLEHAGKWTPMRDVVWCEGGAIAARFGYAELRGRANRLSGALANLGVSDGDRVATLGWNTRHHLELYYGIMGMGAVCHTLNPRLTAAQIAGIADEAGDTVLAVATDLLPLALEVRARCAQIRHVIEIDRPDRPSTASDVIDYETLLAEWGRPFEWGRFPEETAAGLCYTSGTTGRPKGVLYTHRSNYLHTLRALQADAVALTARDTLLMAVPMFHANGWGMPFAAPAAGARLVLPGRQLDGESLFRAMQGESVTVAAGVQTVWLGMVDYMDERGLDLPSLERVIIGGSTCPDALIDRLEARLGARVQTSWGMTELSPIGTMAPAGEPARHGGAAGRPLMGVDLKLTDAEGNTLPDQRGVLGYLKVRGASVADRYFGLDEDVLDPQGWFDTGDLATIDADGDVTIQGRAKDLIKSGGEWINPAEIEAIVGMHPSVRNVAVIGRPDPKWGERPVLVVERDASQPKEDLLERLRGQVADWWIPREVVEIAEMPLAATGKIDKQQLQADLSSGRLIAHAA